MIRFQGRGCPASILTLGLVMLSLCGLCCGGSYERPDNDILFWHAMGGKLGEALTAIVNDFNAQNPDVKVRMEYMGSYASLQQKLVASLAAGNFPDIAQSFETWTTKFVQAGRVVPLSPFLERESRESIEDIWPVFREANSYNGVLWAMPFNKSVPAVYYNQDMFQAADVPFPADDWTWDDFLAKARRLTVDLDGDDRIDQFGFANSLSEWLFQCLLQQHGDTLFDAADRNARFNSPTGIKVLNFLTGLNTKEKISYYSTGFNNQNDFAAGKVSMIVSSCATRIYLEPVLRFKWSCAPLPRATFPAAVISGTNIVLFKGPSQKRIEAAWRFIKFFASTEETLDWALATGYLPIRKSAANSPRMQAAIADNPRIKAPLLELDYSVPSPKILAWNKGRDYLIKALEETYLGNVPAEKSLGRANEKTQKILDLYRND